MLAANSREDPALRPLAVGLAALVVIWAALLRFDAAVGKYGTVADVGISESAQLRIRAAAESLRPETFSWQRVEHPYAGGDPVNYIRFAHRMEHFYGAHPREPGFVFSVKAFIALLGGKDVGITYASAFYSVLLVWATYLLGAFALARWVGLAAAAALAAEPTVISWSVDGWRDDAFSFFVVLSAYTLLRLWERPGRGRAIFAGVVAAGSCLTRLTSLSFIVPAMLFVALSPWRQRNGGQRHTAGAGLQERVRAVALAALVAAVLLGPYLFNCWRAYGDPLHSINFATSFYREREQLESDTRMSVADYLGGRAAADPLRFAGTLLNGMTTYPFDNKWSGFAAWSPPAVPALRLLALAGLALLAWSPQGRFLLVVAAASLLPYAFTWQIPGGSEWRFTAHAYPFYLLAAFWAVHELAGFGAGLSRDDFLCARPRQRRLLGRLALTAAIAGVLWLALVELPHMQVWEDLRAGRAANIRAGPGDARYFVRGWYPPVTHPNVTARFDKGGESLIRLPMLAGRPHRLTLRLQPYHEEGVRQQIVTVRLNGVRLAELQLTWDPNRVGSYEVDVPAEIVMQDNVLALESSWTMRASADSDNTFARKGQEVGFMVWYVNVQALPPGAPRPGGSRR